MSRPRRNDFLIPLLAVTTDAVAIAAAFYLAYVFRFSTFVTAYVPVMEEVPPLSAYLLGALVIAPVWLMMFNTQGVYKARRAVDLSLEFFRVFRMVSLGMLVVMSMAFFYREFSYSRLVFVIIWSFGVVLVFFGRALVLHYEQHLYKKGRELRNLLLVGTNHLAQELAFDVTHNPALGYRLSGYVTGAEARIESVSASRLGGISDLPALVNEHRIETIIICQSEGADELLRSIFTMLEGKSVQLLIQSDVLGITPTRLRVVEVFGTPMLGVKDIPMTSWSRIAKRMFDVVFSLAILLLFSPFGCLIAILIRLESGKPILYSQIRIGLDGKEFLLYKFRTMKTDAEKESGPTWTKRGDPRVTRIGRILRRTSLDEIPQFVNVLKGEMSVVGPRPERPEFVDDFRNYVPKYIERHRLKTGLTGWAQVNGLRGEVPIADRTKYDLYYIENWSLKLDLRIISKTIYAIIFGKDAY